MCFLLLRTRKPRRLREGSRRRRAGPEGGAVSGPRGPNPVLAGLDAELGTDLTDEAVSTTINIM